MKSNNVKSIGKKAAKIALGVGGGLAIGMVGAAITTNPHVIHMVGKVLDKVSGYKVNDIDPFESYKIWSDKLGRYLTDAEIDAFGL